MEWDLATAGLIVAGLTAIGLGIETYFLWKLHRQSQNNQYTETLRKSMDDLYQVYRTDFVVGTKAEAELVATRILDILSILAHLYKEKKIDDKMLDFVKFDLQIAKGIEEAKETLDLIKGEKEIGIIKRLLRKIKK